MYTGMYMLTFGDRSKRDWLLAIGLNTGLEGKRGRKGVYDFRTPYGNRTTATIPAPPTEIVQMLRFPYPL